MCSEILVKYEIPHIVKFIHEITFPFDNGITFGKSDGHTASFPKNNSQQKKGSFA